MIAEPLEVPIDGQPILIIMSQAASSGVDRRWLYKMVIGTTKVYPSPTMALSICIWSIEYLQKEPEIWGIAPAVSNW